MSAEGGWGSMDQILEESKGRVVDDFPGELESDLELNEQSYEGLEQYAEDTVRDYEDTDQAYDIVALSKDLKSNVTDLIAYKELFGQKLDFLDSFRDELVGDENYEFADQYFEQNPHLDDTGLERQDIATINALREGLLYDEIMSMGEEGTWDTTNIGDSRIFDNVNDVADAVIADYFFRGGKGLRSTLGMVTSYGFEQSVEYETMMMGAMAETFHSSTLVQDDLMDGDTERRGRASANVMMNHIFGENGADIPITTGNVMESWTNDLNVHHQLDIPQKSKEAFAKVQDVVNRGQNEDILMGKDMENLTLDDYKHMSMGKTGFLYGGIVKMAAEHSMNNLDYTDEQRDRVNELLGEYTSNFNFAFQSSDDLLEVIGSNMDKSDSDIPNRKRTATALTTDRVLELQDEEIGGVPAEEYFRAFFSTSPEDDPTENIAAAEGIEFTERIFDNQIRRLMRDQEDVHRAQLEGWAEEASRAANDLQDEGFSEGAANLFGKAAEAMNERTH
ncbi:polyprenyl synthetase family protein [Candidatus Nanosalina sp. VS9-1]|uniref:polyprenyl synthetase family protein n=1 Tax=Candidatus Nanosalina sp. VS9-1 TaxID=3388566 RepID=UPI0039E01CDA